MNRPKTSHAAPTREPDSLLDWTPKMVRLFNNWSPPPLAREGDPATSHAAGEKVAATSRESQCAALLKMIEMTPGHIAAYYVGLSGFKGAWRRVSDLVKREQVHYSGTAMGPNGVKCGRVWPGPKT